MEASLLVRVALNIWFVPLHLGAFIFQDRLLRPINRRVLVLCRVAVLATALLLDDSIINPSSMVSIALTGVVMPLVCFRDPLRIRAAVAGLLVATVSFAELLGTAVWMLVVSGAATASYAASWVHYGEHVLGTMSAFVAELAWLMPLARAWLAMRAEATRDGEAGGASLVIALYPVLQACGMLLLATPIMITPNTNAALLLAVTLPCGLCLVANLAMLNASGKLRQRARMEREAAELSAQLDEALAQSEEQLATALQAAHFRHDMRNHRYVVAALAARGEVAQARTYAARLAAELRERAEQEGGAGATPSAPEEARGEHHDG